MRVVDLNGGTFLAFSLGILISLHVVTFGFVSFSDFSVSRLLTLGVMYTAICRVNHWGSNLIRLLFSCSGVFFVHLNYRWFEDNN